MLEQQPLHLPNPNQREASLIVAPGLKFHVGTSYSTAMPPGIHMTRALCLDVSERALLNNERACETSYAGRPKFLPPDPTSCAPSPVRSKITQLSHYGTQLFRHIVPLTMISFSRGCRVSMQANSSSAARVYLVRGCSAVLGSLTSGLSQSTDEAQQRSFTAFRPQNG